MVRCPQPQDLDGNGGPEVDIEESFFAMDFEELENRFGIFETSRSGQCRGSLVLTHVPVSGKSGENVSMYSEKSSDLSWDIFRRHEKNGK